MGSGPLSRRGVTWGRTVTPALADGRHRMANKGGRMKARTWVTTRAASVGVTGAFVLALAGCGGDDAQGDTEATGADTARTATTATANTKGPKLKLIDSD